MSLYDQNEPARLRLNSEINSQKTRVNIDRNCFSKDTTEKNKLRLAKLNNKGVKDEEVIKAFANSDIPNWGGLVFVV